MPAHGSKSDPGFLGGDEFVFTTYHRDNSNVKPAWYLSHGMQRSSDPYFNYWNGAQEGKNLYRGLRDCNIFLENIGKVPDMDVSEKERWICEVKFLKAYYHYWLVRMYGPIPLVKENISVDAPTDETKVYRNTLDECFEYIISLLDEVIDNPYMLDKIENETEELGRVSKAVVYAMKAEIMMTAASPLFNGNTDYLGFTDNRGVEIFNPKKSEAEKLKKWEDAQEIAARMLLQKEAD